MVGGSRSLRPMVLTSVSSAWLSPSLSTVLPLTGDGGRTGGSEEAASAGLPPRRCRLV